MTASPRHASGEPTDDVALPSPGPLHGRMLPSDMFPSGVPWCSARFVLTPSGVRTRILECGPHEARVVLLLHGWGASVYTFRHTMDALRRAGYRAIAIDLKGHGLTDKPEHDDAYTLPSMVDHVEEVVAMLGLSRVAVVAHSMGGAIAMALEARRRGTVTHLALLASSRIGQVPLLPLIRMAAVTPIAYMAPYACSRLVIAGVLRFAHGAPGRFSGLDVDEYWAPTQYPAELRAALALIRHLNWDVLNDDALAALDMPCLVMTGGRDRIISPSGVSSRVERMPRARYVHLEHEGHLFIESSYEVTNQEILTLLARRNQVHA